MWNPEQEDGSSSPDRSRGGREMLSSSERQVRRVPFCRSSGRGYLRAPNVSFCPLKTVDRLVSRQGCQLTSSAYSWTLGFRCTRRFCKAATTFLALPVSHAFVLHRPRYLRPQLGVPAPTDGHTLKPHQIRLCRTPRCSVPSLPMRGSHPSPYLAG